MAYLGTELLKKLIQEKNVISPAPKDFSRVKSGAYELSLGNEVFRTDSKDKKKEILKDDKEQVTINPGQFALLLTEEELNIPTDKIAFISIKAKIKLRGLINVSGFHVDPGFKGKLVFSVYNAGTSPISLEKGEPYFLIWFAELKLTDKESETYNGEHKNQSSIPPAYIDALLAGELASPTALLNKINDNQSALETKINATEESHKSRINLVEKEQKGIDYLVKTVIGISIVILVKFVLDWTIFNTGINKGTELKQTELSADSTINKLLLEKKNLILEIDSLNKIKADTTKTK